MKKKSCNATQIVKIILLYNDEIQEKNRQLFLLHEKENFKF